MFRRSFLTVTLLLTIESTVLADDTVLEFWFSTSDLTTAGPEAPQLELTVGSSVDLYVWCRPMTRTNLRNFSLHVVAEQTGLDLVDGSFTIFNLVSPGVDRFEFVTDSTYNPPLTSEYSELEVVAGNADSVLNLQGFTLFPSASVAGIGPDCGAGELDCVVGLDREPAWLLGSLTAKAVTVGTTIDLHLQVGDFGMNQLVYALGDYDISGLVDEPDYDVWAADFGSTASLAADGNGNSIIDAADYTVWRDHLGTLATLQPTSEVLVQFGSDATPETPQETYNALDDRGITLAGDDPDAVINVVAPAAGAGGVAAPEPTTWALAIFGFAVVAGLRTLKR
jgi:hypothetical protein